ncbi:ABC transporter permease [Azospirillum sp.]|uniref:ABC transporter permease n=1 Tax=Azospirillum sp. TaxID=34012 RepID=UPI002D32FC53|nr:ABC transporter permease [Azospirillum sp.]HYD66195.1 ABC transporter permease [Azospirillum sp.]
MTGRGLVLPALLLAAWEAAHHLGLSDPRLLPPPSLVLARLGREAAEGGLWFHLGASLVRDLAGFAIGAAAGLLGGLLLGLWRGFDRLVGPSFHAWKQIAVFAWIPLISVWFGVGEAAKVVFVALAAFTPVVVNTHEGIRGIDRRHWEVARVLTLTPWQTLVRLVLPAALPSIFTGLHLALIYAWLATVGAEYFMTVGPGIGGMMTEGREHFHMDVVLLGVLILGVVGYALNHGAAAAEARLLHWRHR